MNPGDETLRSHAAPDRGQTEDELLRRIREGDESALPLLFDRHLKTLRGYARRWLPGRLRRKVSVADILQEARIAALRRCLDFEHRGDGSVRNWLLKILEHKVGDAIRLHSEAAQRSVEREVSRGYRPDTGQMLSREPSPSQVAEGRELAAIAARAAETLSEDYREVLRLARGRGLTQREIAEKMDRSPEAVKKLYARALSRFTQAFEKLRGESHG